MPHLERVARLLLIVPLLLLALTPSGCMAPVGADEPSTSASDALSTGARRRKDIARRWAPVFHQQVRDGRDLFTAFDFDGNWAGDDNEENLSACLEGRRSCSLSAVVYFTVIETASHWFVTYLPYHASDGKVVTGHEHDTESVLAVVEKDGSSSGTLVAVEMRFHNKWLAYADGANVTSGAKRLDGSIHVDGAGRPQVHIQQLGHGFCGGYSPPNDRTPDLQLSCKHREPPRLDGRGIVYRPDLPAAPPVLRPGALVEAGYALSEIETSFWARRQAVGLGNPFRSLVDFRGERCNVLACPKQFGGGFMGNRGHSPSGPWDQDGGAGVTAKGSQFFDPAYTMSKRLSFPAGFSLDYCHNSYVGVVDEC